MWSWQSFVDQSPEHRAVGRRRIGHSSVSRKFCAQLDEPCKTGEKRKEVNGWSWAGEMRGILHAGCFLFHGLPLEYNIQSDCPVNE